MAQYQDIDKLRKTRDPLFDQPSLPGEPVQHSGIYRCRGCGREIAANEEDPFPPQNHHQHTLEQGDILWQLVVATDD